MAHPKSITVFSREEYFLILDSMVFSISFEKTSKIFSSCSSETSSQYFLSMAGRLIVELKKLKLNFGKYLCPKLFHEAGLYCCLISFAVNAFCSLSIVIRYIPAGHGLV